MRIAVIGVGHVGLVTAACLAEWGHTVVGLDHDESKVAALQAGRLPFYEPGLDDLVARHHATRALTFTGELGEALDGCDVAFICVGTPSLHGGAPDLSFVEQVGRDIAATAEKPLLLVEKSTVPVNTGERLAQMIGLEQGRVGSVVQIEVASNPEFLREGAAVDDTLHPNRIVLGVPSEAAADVLREVYAPVVGAEQTPVVVTDRPTAELIKHASNAYLAMRISFVNALARISDLTGADVRDVVLGMGHDERIGHHFLRPGIGYGGSCFPKDVDAFIHIAREAGYPFDLLEAVRVINEQQRRLPLEHLEAELWHLNGKTIALLGAAFKPGTDDLREAPAMHLARALLECGAVVRIYDPVALPAVAQELPEAERVSDPLEACVDAHAAVVCTEWPQIAELDLNELCSALGYPVLVDGRNVFAPEDAVEAGLRYRGVGRPVPGR